MKYKLVIFDKDGTLCRSKSGKSFINSVEDQELIPGVAEKIKELKAQGVMIGIASNQGGVAFGYMTEVEASDIMTHAGDLVGTSMWEYCPYHPDSPIEAYAINSDKRKPGPGMLLNRMKWSGTKVQDTLFVGDRPEDEQAAKNAGVDFMWAWQFFGWDEPAH